MLLFSAAHTLAHGAQGYKKGGGTKFGSTDVQRVDGDTLAGRRFRKESSTKDFGRFFHASLLGEQYGNAGR